MQDPTYLAQLRTEGPVVQKNPSWDVDHSKLLAFYRDTLPAHAGCSPSKESFEDEGSGPGIDKFEILRADPTRPFANYSDFKKSTLESQCLHFQHHLWHIEPAV